MKQLPAHECVRKPNKISLPPKTSTRKSPLTLVLDLDETLVHCAVESIPNPDIEFDVNFNGLEYKVRARKRPYLDYFFAAVAPKLDRKSVVLGKIGVVRVDIEGSRSIKKN